MGKIWALGSNVEPVVLPRMGPTIRENAGGKVGSRAVSEPMHLFFHLFNGTEVILDQQGIQVETLADAQASISADIAELQQEFPIEERRGWVLRVTDGSGAILMSIPLDGLTH